MLATQRIIKNAPLDLAFFSKDTSGQVSTGGTGPASTRSIDFVAFAATTNAPVETPASSGLWKLALSESDMAGDVIAIKVAYTGPRTPEGIILRPEPCFDSGLAQAGFAASITLRAAGPSNDLTGSLIEIVRGTGAGQRPRMISAYSGSTKVALVRPSWGTPPDTTSVYIVTHLYDTNLFRIDGSEYAAACLGELYNIGYKNSSFKAGCTSSVLQTNLTGLGTEQILNSVVFCKGVTNNGIMRRIIDYDSSSGQIEVYPPFAGAPGLGESFTVLGTVG